jgi:hypothetical protein
MDEKECVIEDPSIVAYCALKGLQIRPFRKESNRIAFKVKGNVEPILSEILSNKKIPINDFLQALKSIRSTIFTLKGMQR